MNPRPIFLLGMMACGKSHVGHLLAQQLQVPFVDLDRRVERIFGRTIEQLFEAEGEPRFRERESAALFSLLDEPGFSRRGCVVATGGGIVIDARNVEAMRACGHTVYLRVSIERLMQRLEHDAGPGRPLLRALTPLERHQRLTQLLGERDDAYRRAQTIVDGDGDAAQVVAALRTMLEGEAA